MPAIRVARDEVKIKGVAGIKPIALLKWDGSPYGGNPISIVTVCYPVGEIHETENLKFFSSIPEEIINHHADFLAEFMNFIRSNSNSAVLV